MFIEMAARALGTFAGNLDTMPGFHNNLSLDNKENNQEQGTEDTPGGEVFLLCEIVLVAAGPIALSWRDSKLAVFSNVEREPHRLTSSAGKISLGSEHGGAL